MKAKRVSVTVDSVEDYIRLMNTFFQLTDKEIEVISEFIKEKLRRSSGDSSPNTHLFHHSIKRKISKNKFGKTHHHWMNGYIMNLKKKNALIPLAEDGHYEINKGLVPTGEGKIVININWNRNES